MEEETPQFEEFRDPPSRLPFARGGPIYVADHVSPITSVPDFKASVLQKIYDLEAKLTPIGDFEDELSVDELRVFSEEELVEKALKEDFQDASGAVESLPTGEDCNMDVVNGSTTSGKEIICSESPAYGSNNENLGSSASLVDSSTLACPADAPEKKFQRKKSKKRGRVFDRESRAAELEGSYFTKVKDLAKLKQKQDEDKLAARLHSFSGKLKQVEGTMVTSEKNERMQSLRFVTCPVKVKPSTSQEHVPLCYPEVVLCVEIYHKKNTSKKTQEFLVLGSQFLSELRDKIYCLTDKLMQTAEQHDPSGYFLIEDTFCNDLRDPRATDYSRPIFNWLNNCKNEAVEKWEIVMSGDLKRRQKELLGDFDVSTLPTFKATHMNKIRFSDLRFRLGAGYLYCHQGNCKHIIVIRDMRLAHPEDVQNGAEYPLLTFQLRPRHRKCSVCKIYHATKMTVDDKWAPQNPCYFCINCYFLLHYKEDRSLLYDHSVFDYYHEI